MPKVANNFAKCLVDETRLPLQLDALLGRVGSHFTFACLRLLEEIGLRSGEIGAGSDNRDLGGSDVTDRGEL